MMAMAALVCYKQTACLTYIIYFIYHLHHTFALEENQVTIGHDILRPYSNYRGHADVFRNHRHVRDCQPIIHGNTTFETLSKGKDKSSEGTSVKLKMFSKRFDDRTVLGHVVTVPDPLRMFSVLEPLQTGGCRNKQRATVRQSSKEMHCSIAVNAGFFNTHTGECLGNVVSNGHLVRDAHGIQNANFGILRNGTLVTGYLSEDEVTSGVNNSSDFSQLVTGVVWILREGKVYIDESTQAECRETEETGPFQIFTNVVSARTAIGHDADGNVMIVQVDGHTGQMGVNLYEFASILQSYGLVNAINLDGGGSATFVVNQTVVNYPSDEKDHYLSERKVSTILCVHEKNSCLPQDCNGHGHCGIDGQCVCDEIWTGPSCLKKKYKSHIGVMETPSTVLFEESDWSSCIGNSSNCSMKNSTTKALIKRFLVENYAWMDALLAVSLIVNVILLFILFCGGGSSNRVSVKSRPTSKYPGDRDHLLMPNNYDDEI